LSLNVLAYSLGVDSKRLNPWAFRARRLLVDYPEVLQALDRLVRQMRRIASTINEPESAWTELAQKQGWALGHARLLEEMGSTLRSIAERIHSSASPQRNDIPDRETLKTQVEHAQQQLRSWQEQLVLDAKEKQAHMVNAKILHPSASVLVLLFVGRSLPTCAVCLMKCMIWLQ
jgi:hypothetical protein